MKKYDFYVCKNCSIIKRKITNEKKYGVSYYSQSNDFKQKVEETSYKKWGVSNYAKTDEYKKKSKETSNKKWGVDHYLMNSDNYLKLIEICNSFHLLFICPLIIDILDRVFIKINSGLILKTIELTEDDMKIIFSSLLIMVAGLYNQKHPNYSDILILLGFNNNLETIASINKNLLNMINILNYDIYRPFNIYYCSYYLENCICCCENHKNNSINNIIYIHDTKQKNELEKILKEIINNNIIGISPTYYYNRLNNKF
jgi:hypothetical protein